jgi:hypothetical protein
MSDLNKILINDFDLNFLDQNIRDEKILTITNYINNNLADEGEYKIKRDRITTYKDYYVEEFFIYDDLGQIFSLEFKLNVLPLNKINVSIYTKRMSL